MRIPPFPYCKIATMVDYDILGCFYYMFSINSLVYLSTSFIFMARNMLNIPMYYLLHRFLPDGKTMERSQNVRTGGYDHATRRWNRPDGSRCNDGARGWFLRGVFGSRLCEWRCWRFWLRPRPRPWAELWRWRWSRPWRRPGLRFWPWPGARFRSRLRPNGGRLERTRG